MLQVLSLFFIRMKCWLLRTSTKICTPLSLMRQIQPEMICVQMNFMYKYEQSHIHCCKKQYMCGLKMKFLRNFWPKKDKAPSFHTHNSSQLVHCHLFTPLRFCRSASEVKISSLFRSNFVQKEGDEKRARECLFVWLICALHVELHSQSAGLAVLMEEKSERWRRRKRTERRFAQHSEEQRSVNSKHLLYLAIIITSSIWFAASVQHF